MVSGQRPRAPPGAAEKAEKDPKKPKLAPSESKGIASSLGSGVGVTPATGAATSAATDAATSAATGAATGSATGEVQKSAAALAPAQKIQPLSLTELLEMKDSTGLGSAMQMWARQVKAYVDRNILEFCKQNQAKMTFVAPTTSVLLLAPLGISAAAGAALTAFREKMHYGNLHDSINSTGQYEAAGTVFSLQAIDDTDPEWITLGQLEAARYWFSDEAFKASHSVANLRRYSFDVPIPAGVYDINVVRRAGPGAAQDDVVFSVPLRVQAGHAIVLAYYEAMALALQDNEVARVVHLLQAGLSVPIRLRLNPDADAARLACLAFSEGLASAAAAAGAESFWRFAEQVCRLSAYDNSLSNVKLLKKLQDIGITFKGAKLSDAGARGLKQLHQFVSNADCRRAYSLAEMVLPEVKNLTVLSLMAAMLATKEQPIPLFVFVLDCLRVGRLTGEIPSDTFLGKELLMGIRKQDTGKLQLLLKKREFHAFIKYEIELLDSSLSEPLETFATPLSIVAKFAATGANGLVAAFREGRLDSSASFESQLALAVLNRDKKHGAAGTKVEELLWEMWHGAFDDVFQKLCDEEAAAIGAVQQFQWHAFLQDGQTSLHQKHQQLIAEFSNAPMALTTSGEAATGADFVLAMAELDSEGQAAFKKLQETVSQMRRQKVGFVALEGASPDFTNTQLQATWNNMRLGHKYTRSKSDVRAFVLSADLFTPNIAKSGATGSTFKDHVVPNKDAMAHVMDFIVAKRQKDDITLIFDGRSKPCRRVLDQHEDKLAQTQYVPVEFWIVYAVPAKTQEPRVPGRASTYCANNTETFLGFLGKKTHVQRVVPRSDFNACGESSTASTTYTGVPVRRFSELPRMDVTSKGAIVGAAAAGAVKGRRVQHSMEKHGAPLSLFETKPLNFWQRLIEHHRITHIIDFSPGSGALAVAATGAVEYEGVAATTAHHTFLDSVVDKCTLYQAGKTKDFVRKLGGDGDQADLCEKYFGGGMMHQARRMMEPLADDQQSDGTSSDDADDA